MKVKKLIALYYRAIIARDTERIKKLYRKITKKSLKKKKTYVVR